MPYVTSIERLAEEGLQKGIEKGIAKGRQEGVAEGLQIAIIKLLELKFKKVPTKHSRKVRSVRETERLSALFQAWHDAETLDENPRAALRRHGACLT